MRRGAVCACGFWAATAGLTESACQTGAAVIIRPHATWVPFGTWYRATPIMLPCQILADDPERIRRKRSDNLDQRIRCALPSLARVPSRTARAPSAISPTVCSTALAPRAKCAARRSKSSKNINSWPATVSCRMTGLRPKIFRSTPNITPGCWPKRTANWPPNKNSASSISKTHPKAAMAARGMATTTAARITAAKAMADKATTPKTMVARTTATATTATISATAINPKLMAMPRQPMVSPWQAMTMAVW